MSKKGGNISLSSYDDLFETDQSRAEAAQEKIQNVRILDLVPFENHPFRVVDDEAMLRTIESISQFGVLTPVVARPMEGGGYEIISGHRRVHAAEEAGLDEVPVIIRDLDDDEATLLMVDSNLQRETILPSERAFAYRMKKEAIERSLGRPKKEGQLVSNYFGKKTSEIIANGTNDSYKQVERYIRLTNLIPELLDMVDLKRMAFNPAVELSYLKPSEQEALLNGMEWSQATPSLSQAQRLKRLSQEGMLTEELMNEILSEQKKSDLDHITFKNETLRKYFPRSYSSKQMQETIIKLLEQWQKRKEHDNSR